MAFEHEPKATRSTVQPDLEGDGFPTQAQEILREIYEVYFGDFLRYYPSAVMAPNHDKTAIWTDAGRIACASLEERSERHATPSYVTCFIL